MKIGLASMTFVLGSGLTRADVAHLDLALFEEAAEYALKDCAPLEIERVRIERATKGGDNFLGLIYRVKVHVRRSRGAHKVLHFIVKCVPNTEAHEFMHDARVFLKEVICYRDLLPRLEVIFNMGETFGAKLYHARKEPLNTMVLEDLSTFNLQHASREIGLDETHCVALMRKLGKFHALSMLLHRKDPSIMHAFHSGFLSEIVLKGDGTAYRFYGASIAALASIVGNWTGYEKIAPKLRIYAGEFRERLLQSALPASTDITVLNHGDLWTNNLFFKHQPDGEPIDVLFIDFQMSLWGSLGLDINYFFYTSVQLPVLQTRRQHLLRIYYEALTATLVKGKYEELPSFEQVELEVQRRQGYGFFAAFAILPLITLDANAASDNNLDNWDSAEFLREKIRQSYATPRVQAVLKYALKRFDAAGVFD